MPVAKLLTPEWLRLFGALGVMGFLVVGVYYGTQERIAGMEIRNTARDSRIERIESEMSAGRGEQNTINKGILDTLNNINENISGLRVEQAKQSVATEGMKTNQESMIRRFEERRIDDRADRKQDIERVR